jgi:hypothetical protein
MVVQFGERLLDLVILLLRVVKDLPATASIRISRCPCVFSSFGLFTTGARYTAG